VRQGGTALGNRVVVAGGGGGGGGGGSAEFGGGGGGAGGGTDGGPGGNGGGVVAGAGFGGGGGTSAGGGAGGNANGSTGMPGIGGAGGVFSFMGSFGGSGGGGAGGGLFGGGGGGGAIGFGSGGGGGGSGLVPPGGTLTPGVQAGNGLVRITYEVPTAATFSSFAATRSRGGVVVRWRTTFELETLGFRLYRQVGQRRVRVSHSLIPSLGSASGSAYSFLDRRAPKRGMLRYWLQEVALDGSRTWHGPVRVRGT
jgi:hypothetical protein